MLFNNSKKEIAKLKRWYSEQLKLKDEEIKDLNEKNQTLLKSAMKQSHKFADLKIRLEKAIEKKSKK